MVVTPVDVQRFCFDDLIWVKRLFEFDKPGLPSHHGLGGGSMGRSKVLMASFYYPGNDLLASRFYCRGKTSQELNQA